MLVIGETYAERKASLWSYIHTCQGLIKVIKPDTPLAREVIKAERSSIRETYNELKELTRWFKKSGMTETQPYVHPSTIARWNAMTDEEREAEEERIMTIEMQIMAIKEKRGYE